MRKTSPVLAMLPLLLAAGGATAQQYPIMDKVANKVIAKYQSASCEELAAQKAQPKAPPSAEEQRVLQALKNDPQMQKAFFDKVAGPIFTKMFQCGMIP